MPTFAYSTVTFPTPIVFGSPFPTVPAPTVLTPTAGIPTSARLYPHGRRQNILFRMARPSPPIITSHPIIITCLPNTISHTYPFSNHYSHSPAVACFISSSDVSGCYNILYPVKPAQHWDYYVTAGSHSGNIGMTVVSVQGAFGNVNIANQSRGTNSNVQVVCDKDIILNFPFLNAETLLGDALNGTVNVAYAGGVLAPNEAAFNASNWALSWASQYIINGSGTIVYNGNTFNIDDCPIQRHHELPDPRIRCSGVRERHRRGRDVSCAESDLHRAGTSDRHSQRKRYLRRCARAVHAMVCAIYRTR